jgi:hypothetical protein
MIIQSKLSDGEIGAEVLPVALLQAHTVEDLETIKTLAVQYVQDLASAASEADFEKLLPRTLDVLALYDHLTDRRSIGMLFDWLNF